MAEIHENVMTLRTAETDLCGRFRMSALFTALQEVGGEQSAMLGMSREALLERGVAWVLTHAHVQLDKTPRFGEAVTVATFPGPCRHFFFPRYYELWQGGTRVGAASTLYVQLDIASRRMARPWAPEDADLTVPREPVLGWPGVAALPAREPDAEGERVACYSDLDVNGHVNNARYLDWVCDLWDADWHRTHRLADASVQYEREVRPGQRVTLRRWQDGLKCWAEGVTDDGVAFRFQGMWAEE